MSKTIQEQLAEAEAELLDWAAGGRSYWNQVHGSQTGDYAGQFERAAAADAAEIQKQTARVVALRLLAEVQR